MTLVTSEKGRDMIERQQDSRRQRHLNALKECEQFVQQFYDNFKEKQQEIKEKVLMFIDASNVEINKIMAELTDDALLEHDINFVNGAWDKIQLYRNAWKEQI